jgi:hypothetical protein
MVAAASDPPAPAVFAKYQALERAFDPALAALYCDDALIKNTRRYPDGKSRTIQFPVDKYKALIRTAMPLAKSRGDVNDYSATTVKAEGVNSRINTTRHSRLKNYSSPMSLLVGRCRGGEVGILEEISESQP